MLTGMGIALFLASVLGFHSNVSLFLVSYFPMLFKALITVGAFAFVMIFLESLK